MHHTISFQINLSTLFPELFYKDFATLIKITYSCGLHNLLWHGDQLFCSIAMSDYKIWDYFCLTQYGVLIYQHVKIAMYTA